MANYSRLSEARLKRFIENVGTLIILAFAVAVLYSAVKNTLDPSSNHGTADERHTRGK